MSLVDRRDFTLGAGAAIAALAAGTPAIGAMIGNATPAIVIADTRFAASCTFAARAAKAGARVVWTRGDVTDFWHRELDLLWRREDVALSGLTEHPAFFYLARLGMDWGLRVIIRDEHCGLIRWTIAPKPRAGAFA